MKIKALSLLLLFSLSFLFASDSEAEVAKPCGKGNLSLLQQAMRLHDLSDADLRVQKECLNALQVGDTSKMKPPAEPDWFHATVLCPEGIATGLIAAGAHTLNTGIDHTGSGFQLAKDAVTTNFNATVYLATTPPWVVARDAAIDVSSAVHFLAGLDLKKQVSQTVEVLPTIGPAVWELFKMSVATEYDEFACLSKEAQTKKICSFIFFEGPSFILGGALVKSAKWIAALEKLLRAPSIAGSKLARYIGMLIELLHLKDPAEAAKKLKLLIAELQENPDVLKLLNKALDESKDPELKALKEKLARFAGDPEKLLARQAAAAEKVKAKFLNAVKIEELTPATMNQPHFKGAIAKQLALVEKRCAENPSACKRPSILYSQDIKESSLPYKLGLTPVSKNIPSTIENLDEGKDIIITNTIIASKSQNGANGIFYLAHLKDGTPVGVKKFFMSGTVHVKPPKEEVVHAAELNNLGVNGSSLLGVSKGKLGKESDAATGIVFKIIAGDSRGTPSNAQTMMDVEEIIRRLKESPKFNKPQDIQFLRTQNGRVLLIDEVKPATEKSGIDAALETANSTFVDFRLKNVESLGINDGSTYLKNLKKSDAEGYQQLIHQLTRAAVNDPELGKKLKKWTGF